MTEFNTSGDVLVAETSSTPEASSRPLRDPVPADARGWWWGTGRRKTAVARVRIRPAKDQGKGDIKVQITGKKREEHFYWHTGHPGGIKSRTKQQILDGAHPERIVTMAVKRMLQGNKLSRQQMTHLRVYAGAEHPHEAQSPEVLDLKSMNKKNTRS